MAAEDEAQVSRQKESLCEALYGNDGLSDTEEVTDDLANSLREAREKERLKRRAAAPKPAPAAFSTPPIPRSVSFDLPGSNPVETSDTHGKHKPSSGGPDNTMSMSAVDSRKKLLGNDGGFRHPAPKRRRTDSILMRPPAQQIFKGLTFFFIPNDDVAPARRMRIRRAIEFGASRADTWQGCITHIIVDKGLTFDDVLKYLKLDSLPTATSLVNESYLGECITIGSVLDTSHIRFIVNGARPPPTQESISSSGAISTNHSLQLKPARNKVLGVETPLRGEETPTAIPEVSSSADTPIDSHKNTKDNPTQTATGRETDALDKVIEEVKLEINLQPLDSSDEDDGCLVPDSTFQDHSGSEAEHEPNHHAGKQRPAKWKPPRSTPSWQRAFSCMHKHDGNTDKDNPNARTIEVLQQMLDYYNKTSDQWRSLAYRKAISALRKKKEKIVTKDQALSIHGIGERLAAKIEEIAWTNRLRCLEQANMEPHDLLLSQFLNIYGVGFTQASKWIAQGHRSLDDLRTKAALTKNQRIGLDHYDDFLTRIPRAEVEAHGQIVRASVVKADPAMQVIIGGSYRRSAADSGDIDLIITKDGTTTDEIRTLMMDVIVPGLFEQGFLTASLAVSSRGEGSKWHGASVLPDNPVWRRIDLLFVPGDEIGAALVYFTGNDVFNRSLRLLASKKGMCLNQRGLFADVLRQQNRIKLNAGHLLESRDEKRIFELLGVPWRPPHHRIC
ncbi:hypothetical protein AJ80_06039 [Polytolypa hystricis UAMH7299]|uniref:DNA polymerase lambda n=1 Tax=Polytolypa hystricis (strain UAMH7299) TaxID=1447883 RepID=A0A2B7XYS1_POLH7|nr:hypothetical protein AJ80_06039 [Polytolypa hystricis UAMH7299]